MSSMPYYKMKVSVYAENNEARKLVKAVVTFGKDCFPRVQQGEYIKFERVGQRLYFKKVSKENILEDGVFQVMMNSMLNIYTQRENKIHLFMPFRGEYGVTHYDKSLDSHYLDLEDVRDYRRVVENFSNINRRTILLPSVNYISNKETDMYVGNEKEVVKNTNWVRDENGIVVKADTLTVTGELAKRASINLQTCEEADINTNTKPDFEQNILNGIRKCAKAGKKDMANELLMLLMDIV